MGQRMTAAATWTRRRLEAYDWAMGARRVAFAVACGILCGLANVVLCLGVSWAGDAWRALPWLSALLPALAALEVVMYRRLGVVMDLRPGFNGLMKDMGANRRLPTRVGPTMLAGTLMSLLGGASVGPDSAAKYLGASVGAAMVPWFSVDDDNGEPAYDWAVACGLAACFSALLCAPLGVFAYLVEHLAARRCRVRHLPTVLLSCLVAAAFARPMGLQIQTPFVGSRAAAAPDLAGALLVAVGAAVAGVGFEVGVRLLEGLRSRMGRDPMRCLVTGGVVVAVALLVVPGLMGWAGLGTDLVVPALAEPHGGWGFALKLALTVVCLGFGLRGGEVTVMFVTGALMGSAVASLCGADPLLTGALAMAALYGVALGCPISGALVGCEFFGWGFAPWLLPCIGAAWLGRTALKGVVDQVRRHRK